MNGKPFFDTNVLIYTLAEANPRADVARRLLAYGGILSVQVLNEFVAVTRRKYRMSWDEVREAVASIRLLCPESMPADMLTHERALDIAERYGYGIYDSLVIASAIEASCKTLYSEDMQDGQNIQGCTIRNPFREVRAV